MASSAAVAVVNRPCTLLVADLKAEALSVSELKTELESKSDDVKAGALKKLVVATMNGEQLGSDVTMSVIRFCVPSENPKIKKLCYMYWEVENMKGPDGRMRPEYVLVCNMWRQDLLSANEFFCGMTLRFICKVHELEILEPMIGPVRQCLEHSHPYVRRNAVLAIFSIYRQHEMLFPDAPEVIHDFLLKEQHPNAKRNAFLMLFHTAPERAAQYLAATLDQLASQTEQFQLIVVELIRKLCRLNPQDRGKYLRAIVTLLDTGAPSVQYESAITLASLSTAGAAVRAAAQAYISLLAKQSDNNVKMIVLDRLLALKRAQPKVMRDMLLDVMRVLSNPDAELRKKTLKLVLDLLSPRNVDEVILVLKKELVRTEGKEDDTDYRRDLVRTLHACAVRCPHVSTAVTMILLDFLGDRDTGTAHEVFLFVREVLHSSPDLREPVATRLGELLPMITSSKVMRGVLWLMGEYSINAKEVAAALAVVKQCLGSLPFASASEGGNDTSDSRRGSTDPSAAAGDSESTSAAPTTTTTTKVLADGTYATQTAVSEQARDKAVRPIGPNIRRNLLAGDFFLACAVASTLTKLTLKAMDIQADATSRNRLTVEVLLILAGLLHLGEDKVPRAPIDHDSRHRITSCIRVLAQPSPELTEVFLRRTREAFAKLLSESTSSKSPLQNELMSSLDDEADAIPAVQPDDLINFRMLRTKRDLTAVDLEDDDLARVMGAENEPELAQRLQRVCQLTGFSDNVYAEAFVNAHAYDIVLEVLIINQTNETLSNLSLELATMGDLKLVERPQSYTLGPKEHRTIVASIKVSSTETGIVFGNIVYETQGNTAAGYQCVALNDIHVDVLEYLHPAMCDDHSFRQKWIAFEWENKVSVHTQIEDLHTYLQHIQSITNMQCLSPPSALAGPCGFLSANMYARSLFGEDALANLSIERQAGQRITGYIRIRSKSQGIALSIGDRISMKQKRLPESQRPGDQPADSAEDATTAAPAAVQAAA